MFDYSTLYFQNTLNVEDVKTTVGIKIKVGDAEIVWANTTGDLGGEPETLDCTPLSATVQMNKTGIQALDNWTVDYYFNDTDYEALAALKESGEVKTIEVVLPSGAKFTNSGRCTANYATGIAVNGLLTGHAVFELASATGWSYTKTGTDVGG